MIDRPILTRFGPIVIRIAALIIFGISLYTTEFAAARDNGFLVGGRIGRSMSAANLGHFFYFYNGEPDATRDNYDPELLFPWGDFFEDYGPYFLMTINAFVGQTLIGDDYIVTREDVYRMLLGLFLLSALIFLMPNVPLPLSLASVFALWFSIRYGPIELHWNPQAWGTTYTAILLGMALVAAPLPRKRYWSIAFWIGLSILIAFSVMMRQEVTGGIYASMLGTILASALVAVVAYFVMSDRELWKSSVRNFAQRIAIAGVMVIITTFLFPYVVRGLYSLSWNVPYSETSYNQHGASLPLYLGLGFVSNPYNISWLDPVGVFHSRLVDPELTDVNVSWVDVDEPLGKRFREVVLESPWLVGENIEAKAEYMHHYLWHGQTPLPSAFTPGEQPHVLQVLYRLALISLILVAAFAIYRKNLSLLVILSGAAALILGISAGPLMAFPSYIGGPQGFIIFCTMMLPAAAIAYREQLLPEDVRWRITLWSLISVAGFLLLVGILVGGWLLLRWNANQNELERIAAADPLSEIQALEFRYGDYFNQLDQDQQETIIKTLYESDSPSIALPDREFNKEWVFAPLLAVMSENQLHLIVWMGSEFPGPVDYILQGYVYSIIQACAGCDTIIRDYNYTPDSVVYEHLNDTDWNDNYRMLSFAVDADAFQQAGPILVVPQRIRFEHGNATDFNFMVDEFSDGVQLRWNASPSE